ncbi:MAG: M48 family metalloprotease [Planctomycetota bacterium]
MNSLRTVALLTLLTLILVWVGGLVGGRQGMIIALVIGLGLNLFNFFFSSKIILKAYGARILEPGELQWLQDDIRDMTERAGLPMPKVAYIPKSAPNAFATGRSPQRAVVAVTQGALDVLDRRQLRAVMGHELAHVKHRDMLTMTVVAGVVSAIGFLAMMARWGAIFGGGDDDANPLALIAIAIFAPLMAALVQFAISRSREYAADAGGATFSEDPAALADALEALHRNIPRAAPLSTSGSTAHLMIANPFFGMKVGRLFSTHPDPKERIRRLREMAAGHR